MDGQMTVIFLIAKHLARFAKFPYEQVGFSHRISPQLRLKQKKVSTTNVQSPRRGVRAGTGVGVCGADMVR
jgi:hypothetical protein